MLAYLNSPSSLASAELALRQLLQDHSEWFLAQDWRAPVALKSSEFDFSIAHERLILSSWTEAGSRSWRITAWGWTGEKLLLEASRRAGAEVATLELVPRASAKALVASIAAARQARCEKIAQLVAEGLGDMVLGVKDEGVGDRVWGVVPPALHPTPYLPHPKAKLHPKPYPQHPKVERATLSPGMRRGQPGRYARIVLRAPHQRIAVTSTVAQIDSRNVDALFSSALLWFNRLIATPKRPSIERLLIVVERNVLEAARQRQALLRESFRERIELLRTDEGLEQLERVRLLERRNLWRKRLTRLSGVPEETVSERVNEIVARAPEAIDVVNSRHGQTLRYHGLPFARVRRVMNRERVWFGVEGAPRRALDYQHEADWAKLIRDLKAYRRAGCRDRRHWFYRAAGEAWLESILRRDISKLDPGLIVAPLHAQFRTAHGGAMGARPIDLLALRQDGRLAVIELKVNEDREHVFQGVDYWRRVEAHRRRGHISSAKLFGEREIADESPLVYLVAPALRFHPSFRTLAKMIAPDIEIYRFEINEDWRAGVRVVRRERVNA